MFPGCIRGPRSSHGSTDDITKQTKSIVQVRRLFFCQYLWNGHSSINELIFVVCTHRFIFTVSYILIHSPDEKSTYKKQGYIKSKQKYFFLYTDDTHGKNNSRHIC